MTTPARRLEPSTDERARGAIWGQLAGDAAALGSHWIYDLDEMHARFPSGLAGFEAPAPGHYHEGKTPGDLTHYGDGALALLESLAETGSFDACAFGLRFLRTFEPGVYPGYLDHATKGTFARYRTFAETHRADEYDFQQGADDDQLATVSRLAALAVRHRNDPDFFAKAESLTRVCQDNARAVAYAVADAAILAGLLNGEEVAATLASAAQEVVRRHPVEGAEVAESMRRAEAAVGEDVVTATLRFGQACPLEHSFPAAVHALLKHGTNFQEAILATVRAGGDNAGRAAMLGGWLGAHLGLNAIPSSWRGRLHARDRITAAIDRVMEAARVG